MAQQFPRTPVLDSFSRSDESPLSGGGNWITYPAWWGDGLELSSGQARMTPGDPNGYAGSYWEASQFGGRPEWFCTVATVPAPFEALYLELNDAGSDLVSGLPNAYWLGWGGGETMRVRRWDAGAERTIAITTVTVSDGDGIGLRLDPSSGRIQAWHRSASNGAWVLVVELVDMTHNGSLWIPSIGVVGEGVRIDNVGGGST